MNYSVTIPIEKKELQEIQEFLNRKTADPYLGDVPWTFTAKFGNGFEADIKACNGDSPYVDPVLFDQNGNELVIGEVTDTIVGEYFFHYNEDEYVVNVVEKTPNWWKKS